MANYLEFKSSHSILLRTYNAQKNWDGILEYSNDGVLWTVWDGNLITSSTGRMCLRGTGNTRIAGLTTEHLDNVFLEYRWFFMGQEISCIGNIENLLDYGMVAEGEHPPMADGCFNYLFYECENLISAPELPATTLSERCYLNLFYGTGITEAPALPATTLTYQCYFGMFESCKNLTTLPVLPATTLAAECYKHMFQYCTSLTKIPNLPATTLERECYAYMFRGCSRLGISTIQTEEYKTAYRLPASGTAIMASDALKDMFVYTGGTFSGTPSINTTYYLSEGAIPKTHIAYNGSKIASLDDGQTGTIKTSGCESAHDIIITPAFPINITYGDIIVTANEGQTAIIKCANTELEHDILISARQ